MPRDIDLKDLRVFIAVADAAGFRKAAVQLGTRQSVVSGRVRALEDVIGVSLFERTPAGARLTNAGVQFFSDVRSILGRLDIAVRNARASGRGGEGRLCLGIVASLSSGFLRSALDACKLEHPNVALEVVDGSAPDHLAALQNREIDCAVVTGRPNAAGLDAEILFEEAIFVAISTTHILSRRAELIWDDLAPLSFVVSRDAPGPEIHDYIIKHLAGLGRSPSVVVQSVGRETLLNMVGMGMGVTFVSGAEADVVYPGVRFVALSSERLPFSFVWSPANDNPALRRFLSLARVRAKEAALIDALLRRRDPSP